MVAPPRRARELERPSDRGDRSVASSRLIDEYLRDQDQRLERIGNSPDRYRTADGGEVRLDNRGRPIEICGPRRSDGSRTLITGIRYDGDSNYATHMSYGGIGRYGSRNVRENWRLVPGPDGPSAGGVWTTAAEGARPESGRRTRCGPVTVSRHGVLSYNEVDRRGTNYNVVRDLRNSTIFVPRDGQMTPVGEPGERRFETADRSEVRLDEHGRPVEILGPVRSNGTRSMVTGIRYHGDTNYATHMSYGTLDRDGNRILRENWRLIPNEGGPAAGGIWTTAGEGARPEQGRRQRCGPVTVSRDGVVNYNDTSSNGRPVAALRDTSNRTVRTPHRRAEAPPPRIDAPSPPPVAPPPPRPEAPPPDLTRIPQPNDNYTENDDGSYTWRDATNRVIFVQADDSDELTYIRRDNNGNPDLIAYGEPGETPTHVLRRGTDGRWQLRRGAEPPVDVQGVDVDSHGNVTIRHTNTSGLIAERWGRSGEVTIHRNSIDLTHRFANGNRFETYTELGDDERPTYRFRTVDSQGRVIQSGTLPIRIHSFESYNDGLQLWPEQGSDGLHIAPDGTTSPVFRAVPLT